MITFKDFQKIELRIAKILQAERIEGSDKLLKLKITLGKEERQLVAGIAKQYNPEDVEGREIVVVVNLEPKEIFGEESQGMLLAANIKGEPVLLKPEREVPPGSKIS